MRVCPGFSFFGLHWGEPGEGYGSNSGFATGFHPYPSPNSSQ